MTRQLDCEEVIEALFLHLDGEVDEGLGERIEEHLARCRECFTRAEFERKLSARVAESAAEPAPPRLRMRIRRLLSDF